MPRYQLDLCLRHAEGALARVIGTVERRGFRPVGVQGRAVVGAGVQGRALVGAGEQGGDHWRLHLAVEGERPIGPLTAQLGKVYDCLAVAATPCTDAGGGGHV